MGAWELNRDIERLKATYLNLLEVYEHDNIIDTEITDTIKPEFLRLYRADEKFEQVYKDNALFMYRLNLRHLFIPLHTFGIHIEIKI